jgi:hypothetical protein
VPYSFRCHRNVYWSHIATEHPPEYENSQDVAVATRTTRLPVWISNDLDGHTGSFNADQGPESFLIHVAVSE